jgi:diguanylate cyclase (GGDEF)-like protein/PAS domain S-box-containing protein
MTRNEAAVITSVDDTVHDLLGWRPEQLIGSPSTALIHPNDQASAVSAWFSMINAPRSTRVWRGRYRTAGGDWCWIEATNTNQLDSADEPGVFTVMRAADADYLDVEEELRAREELLTRLSDAVPVGVFQVDRDRRMLSTNGRLHAILGVPPAGNVWSQFVVVAESDLLVLEKAIRSVLEGEEVDDLELRFHATVPHPDFSSIRVCQVSMRPLTDGADAVTGVVGVLSDVTDSVELRRELEVRASTDFLTGCLNRAATFELLDAVLRAAAASRTGVGAIYVDLDEFKNVNDEYGHAAGDRALLSAADTIRCAIRSDDVLGRLGGDEFLVVCPRTANVDDATAVAHRISGAFGAGEPADGGGIPLRASVGLAWTDGRDGSADSLVARADAAMYESKAGGLGSVVQASSGRGL